MNRRHFLLGTATSVALPKKGRSSPNDTIRVACIGVGNPDIGVKGQGCVHLQRYSEMHNVEVAAICDVDRRLIAHGQGLVEKVGRKKPAGFTDIRKVLEDKSIDAVITLGAPIALIAIQGIQSAKSSAKLYTFDTNAAEIAKIKSGAVQWAVDQQPYVQGYEAIDSLWLYLTNGDVLGGGQTVLTGPSFIDSSNVGKVATYAQRGTR